MHISKRHLMKIIFILLLSVCSAHLLQAQTKGGSVKHRQIIAQLLQQHGDGRNAMRTTAGTSTDRVIAQSTHDSTGAITDSVGLYYATNMWSTFDFNTMAYPYGYSYSSSPMFNYAGDFTKPQVLYDTCLHYTQDPFTLVYGLYESTAATYNASKNLVTFRDIFTDSVTNANMSYINRFNSANNIDSGYWFKLAAGAADSAFKQFFVYNTSGKLSGDSVYEYHLGVWHMVAKSKYTYDASENLVQIDYFANDTDTSFTQPLFEKEQYINTYDTSNRLLTVLNNTYNNTTLAGNVKDTFAYTGAHTYHTSWREYQYDPINGYWAPMFNMSKTINAAGFPDTVNIDGFDSIMNAWVPQTLDVYHYNSFNLPDTMREYDYNFTSFPSSPSYTTLYYYQTYINTVATQNVPAVPERVSIYPNPATNTITIVQPDLPKNTMISVSLINVSGQMVCREKIPGQNEIQLSVSDLVPGVYWVVIQDDGGNVLHRQIIVKQ